MKLTILILVFAFAASGQQTTCDHQSGRLERFRQVRTFPVKVKRFDGNKITVRAEDDREIQLLELRTDEKSDVPKKFKDGRLYWILYCTKDYYLYAIWEVKRE